ncbi:hypothetical protein JOC37_001340 [Desulfohalotomaculum tongense]|nr:hypothetical protein [Desulforadius tongensis]
MFWYAVLTSVGGGFLLLLIVRSGYSYMRSAMNPGIRASFIEDVQRSVLAMGLVALAPVFITILSGINDGFVWICGKLLNSFATSPELEQPVMSQAAGMFEQIIAAPFNAIIIMFNELFGLKSLDQLIFNGQTNIFGSSLLSSIQTGNLFADALLNLSMVAFDVYFNAVYTIRKWVVTANIVVTPIIAWIWMLTAERQVLEIWVAEIIQTIFLQSAHAMSLGIFLSIATGVGKVAGKVDTAWFSSGLVQIGVFFAAFASSICVAVLVVLGIRIIIARKQEERAKAKEGLIKAFIGLFILGLCVVIASFLAVLLSGSWGVK